ncbi:hypothetical protein OQA88_5946 [Cercophora sp. LCS_1]
MSSKLTSRMGKLNPFKKGRDVDDEDQGEEIDETSVAGGGHSAAVEDAKRRELRVGDAVRDFLVQEGVVAEGDEAGLRALIEKHHLSVPARVTDPNFALPEYFISSSHNTYLLAHQLYGSSSATAYEATLHAGARCIEIDAWDDSDNPSEPKVTHGYTLVSNIPFRTVCETIRSVSDAEASLPTPSPILISLENHCNPAGQLRLVEIMHEVFGHRLLSAPINPDSPSHVTLSELGSKILVIVEHHLPDEESSASSSSSSSSSEDEESKDARTNYRKKRKETPSKIIIPELAALGIYAQSVKPVNTSWFSSPDGLENAPHHPLINVSEVGIAGHMASNGPAIARHNAKHLMRVFPKGTRISSENLKPVAFWGLGAQICALNWQTFGAGMQLNDALFAGTAGYVLKPKELREGGSGVAVGERKKRLRLRVAGANDVGVKKGREGEDAKLYLTCTLLHPGGSEKKKTGVWKGKSEEGMDPWWGEVLEWEFGESELVFLRMFVKDDVSFSGNPILAVAAVRLLYVVGGWVVVPMLDLRGHETKTSVLVKFEVEDV